MAEKETTLDKILTRAALRRMAGGRSFERGEEYYHDGSVGKLAESRDKIKAKVSGTHPYQVALWVSDGELDYSCTCPFARDDNFCKHCVAVGLKYVEEHISGRKPKGKGPRLAGVTDKDIRSYLAGQGPDKLMEMIMELAGENDELYRSLLLQTAKKLSGGLDLDSFRRAIDQAMDHDDFVGYQDSYSYTRGIDKVADELEALLGEGRAAEAIELTEYALAAAEDAINYVDDSDGYFGEIFSRLQEIHHSACMIARPDPENLARRLFDWEVKGEWDIFVDTVGIYFDVLGEEGLAVYRQLAEAHWSRLRPLGPGEDDPERFGKRYRITHIMEALARHSGDIEELVEIKSRDRSSPYAYVEIAGIYKEARKHDLALEWAERGLQAFPQRTDFRLREFLAGEYHRRGLHDRAMKLIWEEFTDYPSLSSYTNLKVNADQDGSWPAWREKALKMIRKSIADKKKSGSGLGGGGGIRTNPSVLVEIFLGENDVESAWREAQAEGCSERLWLELARKREQEHPEDSVAVYQKLVESTLGRKNKPAYQEALQLIKKIRGLMDNLGRQADFSEYLVSVRARHKPKRNFMALLDNVK